MRKNQYRVLEYIAVILLVMANGLLGWIAYMWYLDQQESSQPEKSEPSPIVATTETAPLFAAQDYEKLMIRLKSLDANISLVSQDISKLNTSAIQFVFLRDEIADLKVRISELDIRIDKMRAVPKEKRSAAFTKALNDLLVHKERLRKEISQRTATVDAVVKRLEELHTKKLKSHARSFGTSK